SRRCGNASKRDRMELEVDTFELLPSLAQGDLRDTSAAELVAAVFRSRASGTLAIEGKGTGEIRAFFRAGDMCGSATFPGFRTLAHVLLANDWMDALQIEATQQAAAGDRLMEAGSPGSPRRGDTTDTPLPSVSVEELSAEFARSER